MNTSVSRSILHLVVFSSESLISFVFKKIKLLDLSCDFVEGVHYSPAPQSGRSICPRPDRRHITRSLPLISLSSAFDPSDIILPRLLPVTFSQEGGSPTECLSVALC